MRNYRRAQFLLLLAALVAGHQRVATAGSVSATWTGPANDPTASTATISISSPVSPGLAVQNFTGTTGPAFYYWEGGSNSISLTFNLQGGGTKSIPLVTPTGATFTDYTLASLFNPSTPLAINGTVTGITLTETQPCFPGGPCGFDITALTSGEGGGSQVFNFTPAPEPAGMAVLGSALVGLAAVRRRRVAG